MLDGWLAAANGLQIRHRFLGNIEAEYDTLESQFDEQPSFEQHSMGRYSSIVLSHNFFYENRVEFSIDISSYAILVYIPHE